MNKNESTADAWLWLTVPIAILLAIAAGTGVLVQGLYRDAPSLVAQAQGQDLVTLVIMLPTLIVTAILTGRGSRRARLLCLGALVYTLYTYVGYAFDVRFNSLFLVYVALVGCSTYALIGGLARTDWVAISTGLTEGVSAKAVSIYLIGVTVLFYLLWLGEVVPASLAGNPPRSVLDAETPTNFVHVLDMAWLLPAFALTAVNLWRKRPLGYVLAGALLAHNVLLTLAILSMVAYEARAGERVVIPQVVMFGVLLAVTIGMVIAHLWNLQSSHIRNRTHTG